MQSIRLYQFGDPAEVLQVEEMHLPELNEGQVLVKMTTRRGKVLPVS